MLRNNVCTLVATCVDTVDKVWITYSIRDVQRVPYIPTNVAGLSPHVVQRQAIHMEYVVHVVLLFSALLHVGHVVCRARELLVSSVRGESPGEGKHGVPPTLRPGNTYDTYVVHVLNTLFPTSFMCLTILSPT